MSCGNCNLIDWLPFSPSSQPTLSESFINVTYPTMLRTYSIFATNQELLASPYVRALSRAHDVTLRVGEEEVINFLVQQRLSVEDEGQVYLLYDPQTLDCLTVHIERFAKQTLITLRMIAREMGSLKLGLSVPTLPQDHEVPQPSAYTTKNVPT